MSKVLISGLFLIFTLTLPAQSWQRLPSEKLPEKRHENAFVKAGNKLLLIGGRGKKPIDVYNLDKKDWSKGQQPPLEIHHFQAVTLDGLVYIIGAFTGGWPNETPISHILIYNPEDDFWSIGPEIPENRRRGAAGVSVYKSKIYISNGIINGHTSGWISWFDEFDPYKNAWKKLPNSPRPRDHFQSVVVKDKLFVAGGRKSGSVENSGFGGTVKPTDVYDFISGSWREVAEIPTPRAGTAATVFNEKPVILGGESDKQETAHSEVEIFDMHNETWKNLPDLQNGRHGTQVINLNNQLIIGAGSGNRGGGPELDDFEVFLTSEQIDFGNKEIIPGKLKVSVEEIDFNNGENQKISLENQGGNQAQLISYIQIDNKEAFQIKNRKSLPKILAPNTGVDIELKAQKSGEGFLLIKPEGDKEPILVTLKN